MLAENEKQFFLFDVDGTLTEPRKPIDERIVTMLKELKTKPNYSIGVVGGSDYSKIIEQIKYPEMFDYMFCENGLVAYKNNELFFSESIVNFLGEKKLKQLINYCLVYIAKLDIPIKRGTFIEFRKGLLNISPIGRNCSYHERMEFAIYNMEYQILETFRNNLLKEFESFNLTFSIGGQISIDCFPKGWDKRFCLKHVEGKFSRIHFIGDKTNKGGNDYEIYNDTRVIGYSVKTPEDTIELLKNFLSS